QMICDLARYEREESSVKLVAEDLVIAMNLPNPPFHCAIAEADGKPCGFALYYYAFSTWEGRTLYLEDLFVYPENRGEGVGGMLMTHLALRATQDGCRRFEWSVLNWNEPAIQFYDRLGARAMNEWTRYRMDIDSIDNLLARNASV